MLGVGVTAVMVVMECLAVGLVTLTKEAMNKGMSNYVYVVYSTGFGTTFILLPATLIYYRKRGRRPLTASIICRIFFLALIGCCLQTCSFAGIRYSSPILGAVIYDLTPAFTFILAIISRMEKLDLRVQSSLAKSIGSVVSVTGALTATLYKGPAITITSSLANLHTEFLSQQKNWVIGGLLLAAGSFSLSLYYVVQTSLIRMYPEELMVTFLSCTFVTFQSAILALIVERNPNAWKLKPDVELIAVVYSAIFGIAIQGVVQTWACRKKGPFYVSMFKPLSIIIAVVMGVTFLGETLHLGSVVGSAIIAVGFYSVIWGQVKEEKVVEKEGINSFKSSSNKAPLLENRVMEA